LDTAAPNNPVIVRDIFVATLLNQKAIDILKTLPFYQDLMKDRGGPVVSEQTGLGASHRWAVPDLLFKDFYPQLREAYRLGLEWWAGYGITTIGSACYNPRCTVTYGDLDRRNQMPIRMMWAWNWRQEYFYQDDYFIAALVGQLNKGSDYFWNGGGLPGPSGRASGCGGSSLEIVDPRLREEIKGLNPQESGNSILLSLVTKAPSSSNCDPDPHSPAFRYVKAGGRIATQHHSYDKDVDNTMDLVEKASQAAGFTLEEVRAKRHAFDHNAIHPRPDQVPRLKQLGMIAGGNAFEIWDSSTEVLKYFGERAVNWVVPKKTLIDGGLYSSFEIDRAIGTTDLTVFECCVAPMITRKAWDGKVYAPGQKISRELALKTTTIWPARYVLREEVLGSLKPGKWADFLVLDRDYLTIPEDDIAKVRVMMAVVGGRVIHLVPSLAREVGMQPEGSQVTLGGPAAQW
ncbi:MAG: amidohydrolase family protein, partial [Acidobacteria bacterium]|nr:amidohydrolase family protein [Acidobacteriota bacterium]